MDREDFVTQLDQFGETGILDQIIVIGPDEHVVRDLLMINEADTTTEYSHHAALLGFWAVTQANVESNYLRHKDARERVFSRLYKKYREILQQHNKKVTEAMITAEVVLDKEYIALSNIERDAQEQMEVVKSFVSALRVRGDMLVQLGANLRKEQTILNEEVKRQLRG